MILTASEVALRLIHTPLSYVLSGPGRPEQLPLGFHRTVTDARTEGMTNAEATRAEEAILVKSILVEFAEE